MKPYPHSAFAAALVCSILLLSGPPGGAAPAVQTFYVAPDGDDSAAGSLAAPWRTINKAANSVGPGSVINVRAGIYPEAVTVGRSGAPGRYLTIQSYPGERAILDGTDVPIPDGDAGLFLLLDNSYVVIQGFEIRNWKTSKRDEVPVGINVRGSAHHIQLRNNDVHHIEALHPEGNAHGIAIFGTKPTPLSDVLIDGNAVHDLKLGSSEALVLNGNVKHFTITNNKVHDNDNIGIDLIGFEQTCTDRGCVDQVRDGVCRGNQVYGISSAKNPAYKGDRSAGGIYVDGGTNIIIERNVVRDCDIGIELASEHRGKATSNIIVRNNWIYRSFQAGISIGGYDSKRGATTGCKIVNNTLFQNGQLGQIFVQFDTSNNVITNNIIHGGTDNQFINNEHTKNSGNLVDYNIYFSNAGPTAGLWRWKNKEYQGWSTYVARSGIDKNSRFINPGLASTGATPNLKLQPGSPARDAGDRRHVQAGDLDVDGEARIQGTGVDIGADECKPDSKPAAAATVPAAGPAPAAR